MVSSSRKDFLFIFTDHQWTTSDRLRWLQLASLVGVLLLVLLSCSPSGVCTGNMTIIKILDERKWLWLFPSSVLGSCGIICASQLPLCTLVCASQVLWSHWQTSEEIRSNGRHSPGLPLSWSYLLEIYFTFAQWLSLGTVRKLACGGLLHHCQK